MFLTRANSWSSGTAVAASQPAQDGNATTPRKFCTHLLDLQRQLVSDGVRATEAEPMGVENAARRARADGLLTYRTDTPNTKRTCNTNIHGVTQTHNGGYSRLSSQKGSLMQNTSSKKVTSGESGGVRPK